ncbi:MAG TPA: hypothetical protein VHX88_05205 [Solirubrobacteraceae bacterium]|jgi:hypothetical protein|nr:hypothetical protein [Solirubrobacteraceae bacterium]
MARRLALLVVLALALPAAALAAGSGYAAAKRQWEAAPCRAAAVQGGYWRRAAADLGRRPQHAGAARAIRELRTLAALPETSETTAQMHEFTADARALNGFFHTPGNLIGRGEYCHSPG